MDGITYPCPNPRWTLLVKGSPDVATAMGKKSYSLHTWPYTSRVVWMTKNSSAMQWVVSKAWLLGVSLNDVTLFLESLSANESAAFKWNVHCHWLNAAIEDTTVLAWAIITCLSSMFVRHDVYIWELPWYA